jgi:hypothetical protein
LTDLFSELVLYRVILKSVPKLSKGTQEYEQLSLWHQLSKIIILVISGIKLLNDTPFKVCPIVKIMVLITKCDYIIYLKIIMI